MVTPAATVAISVKVVVPPGARSMLKVVSLLELSVQLRLTCVEETVMAVRLVGAAGIAGKTPMVMVPKLAV